MLLPVDACCRDNTPVAISALHDGLPGGKGRQLASRADWTSQPQCVPVWAPDSLGPCNPALDILQGSTCCG